MNTFDLPVVRWCMLHVANGDLFYIALVLLTLAAALRLAASWRAMYRWRHVLALLTGVGCFALILAASSLTLAWLAYLGLLAVGACLYRPQRRLRLAVAALLRLHHDTAPAVEVDAPSVAAPGVGEGHRSFETIVVGRAVAVGRLGPFDAKQIREFGGKALKIGHLAAAGGFPALNEGVDGGEIVGHERFGISEKDTQCAI